MIINNIKQTQRTQVLKVYILLCFKLYLKTSERNENELPWNVEVNKKAFHVGFFIYKQQLQLFYPVLRQRMQLLYTLLRISLF